MAVLTGFHGAHAVLDVHSALLPQPDQVCGPFAAHVALHALTDRPPPVTVIAAASGTAIWPHDVSAWRPAGAPLDRAGWDRLPRARSPRESGTVAAGLAAGLQAVAGVAVVPVPAPPAPDLASLLTGLLDTDYPVGVLANVRTGPLGPDGAGWDVGHFVILHGYDPDAGAVGVADTYRELGEAGQPPGCRTVGLHALAVALAGAPGRGLLLLVRPENGSAVHDLVTSLSLPIGLWST